MDFDPQTDPLLFDDPDESATAPSRDARALHLQRVPLFSGLNEDELGRVAELSRIAEVPAGTVVTQTGEPGDSFFIIIDGAVTVRTPVGVDRQLQPGDFFGEMSLIDGEPRSATIVASTDLRLLIVDRSHFCPRGGSVSKIVEAEVPNPRSPKSQLQSHVPSRRRTEDVRARSCFAAPRRPTQSGGVASDFRDG